MIALPSTTWGAKMLSLKAVGLIIAAALFVGAGMFFPAQQNSVVLTPLSDLFVDGRDKNFATPKPGSYKLPVIKPAGDGDMLDIDGKPVRLTALTKGKVSLISFVYTSCSVEKGCPYSMSTLFDIFHSSEKVSGLADNANLITISFDPKRDTPEAMASFGYAALADKQRDRKLPWHFLTTSSVKELAPILKSYGQAISQQKGSDTIDHLLRLYLVDRKGQVRNIYGLGFMDVRLLYTDIYTLLLEDGTITQPGT